MDNILPKTRVLVISERPDMMPELTKEIEHNPEIELLGDIVHPESALNSRFISPSVTPDVVAITDGGVSEHLFDLVEKLLTKWPNTLIVTVAPPMDAEAIQQMLLNGVRAVLPMSWDRSKIVESLRKLHLQEWYRIQGVTGQGREKARGKVITILGAKGGIGKTFLAVNLAVALKKVSGKEIALVDADWGDVDLSLYMNLVSRYNVADLLSHHEEMDDSLVSGVLTQHSSGVEVLTAPKKPFGLPEVPPDFFSRLFSLLRARFSYVVVDTGARIDEVTAGVIENSDLILMTVTPDVASLQQASSLLETLHSWNFPEEKVRLLINRATYSGGIPEKEIESFFGVNPLATLPEETGDAMVSVNKGIPLLQSDSGTLAREIKKLARTLAEDDSTVSNSSGKPFKTKKVLPLERPKKKMSIGQVLWIFGHTFGR